MRLRGMLDLPALERAVEAGEIETVVTALPDLFGRLVGKRIVGRFFLEETAIHGMHVCDYLLACDMPRLGGRVRVNGTRARVSRAPLPGTSPATTRREARA